MNGNKRKSESSFSHIINYLKSLNIQQRLYVFALILIICTAFSLKQLFYPASNISQPSTYTLTQNDFGKTISVKKGDIITLNLPLSKDITSLITQPQGIVQQISNTDNTFQLQAVQSGTAIITATSRPYCQPGAVCSALVILNFKATIVVY